MGEREDSQVRGSRKIAGMFCWKMRIFWECNNERQGAFLGLEKQEHSGIVCWKRGILGSFLQIIMREKEHSQIWRSRKTQECSAGKQEPCRARERLRKVLEIRAGEADESLGESGKSQQDYSEGKIQQALDLRNHQELRRAPTLAPNPLAFDGIWLPSHGHGCIPVGRRGRWHRARGQWWPQGGGQGCARPVPPPGWHTGTPSAFPAAPAGDLRNPHMRTNPCPFVARCQRRCPPPCPGFPAGNGECWQGSGSSLLSVEKCPWVSGQGDACDISWRRVAVGGHAPQGAVALPRASSWRLAIV
ncbi:uncharacterized protein LOC125337361 [Corvus hawaiiensis]|uniref:uncharacterized protein LOC125337361 n=1 Tax=Corvus hawaiiensis TaxID=134902 RepID=UPI0020196B99|nr:uncharacterized protein LOC125337361 [Corvus hawaiiensis]XP_048182956.1 uncharacterized protein LOC125337361 [Corvus hawaiiensis]XP_048182957.1 uncharacterized protein LOC125337361 [Corvus hawaiiensis]XP_048182958.1 uncharacterized protein LOC125337361 [Corvus hawaiiensis]XP_048182959.1 uncharacterized protein LOC125337361 [Corvus hawaiiensis]